MIPRRLLAYGVLASVAVTLQAAVSPAVFAIVDLRVYDAMLRATNARPASDRVAIVAIDDRSLSEIGRWPWPRDVVARLIRAISDAGARATAIDLLLAGNEQPDAGGPTPSPPDEALAGAVATGRVVTGYALTFDTREEGGNCVLHPIVAGLVESRDGRSPLDQLFHATGVLCSLPALSRAAGSSGFLNASPDRDGLLRRVPLVMEFHGAVYPSLALAAVAKAAGVRRMTLTSLAGERADLTIDALRIPLDARGTLLIRFRGVPGAYQRVSASDVLNGRMRADALRDRLVFVGATALGIQDVVSTPTAIAAPGIEVHAAAADMLLQRDFVTTPSYSRAYEVAATALFGLAVAIGVAFGGFLRGASGAGILLALLWVATFTGLSARGVFLSPVFPTLGAVAVLVVLAVPKARDERRRAEAERVRRERAHAFAVQSLTSLLEARDGATGRHARRTQEYARLLATELARVPRFRTELTPEYVELITELCPLHDLGKVGVRDAVLNKPGLLSDDERDEMRRHPGFGHETLASAERRAGGEGSELLLRIAKDLVYTHHEWWDGRGYPRGLKGDQIPIAGRIVALVDVYDALSHRRAYRAEVSHDEAVALIVAGRGTQFDPDVVDAFLRLADRFRDVSMRFGDETVEMVDKARVRHRRHAGDHVR